MRYPFHVASVLAVLTLSAWCMPAAMAAELSSSTIT